MLSTKETTGSYYIPTLRQHDVLLKVWRRKFEQSEVAMEIAAASTVSVAPQLPRLTNAFSRKLGSVSSLSFGSLKRNYCVGKVSASSSVDVITADKISPASFLDKRETGGVLHFVKYHGLGNDFILVTFGFPRNASDSYTCF